MPNFNHSIKPLIAALAIVLGNASGGLVAAAESRSATDAATDASAHEIKDPYYGETLFQFYQDHYFTTLTGLMVSQHFNRVSHHSEEAEVLRGGILLSYGMHREAGAVFERLIDIGASPATRDRAWFYLAKIRYQRGYLPEAETALNHIGDALPDNLKEERGLLQANLLMARANYAGAIAVLQPLELTSVDATYVRYNLGIALIKTGSAERGFAMLDLVGVAPAGDEEHRSLRDRANLALGFSAMAANKNVDARNYFERIRLKSAQANKALLGMGWTSIAGKDYKQALVPWQELAQRDDNDTAELEAKLAIPYAYAELGAYGQSARLYNQAINSFSREDGELGESIDAIQSGKLTEALLAENPGDDMGWFWSIKALPNMPHASHLARVLAQHEFQEAFKNYRDLRFLTKNLQDWREKLKVFSAMLENRRSAFAERLPQVMEQAQHIGLPAMRDRQDQIAHQIAEDESGADDSGAAYADGKQLAALARITEAQQLINQHPDASEFSAANDKVRLAHGALIWQLAQAHTERAWQAHKDMQDITEQLNHVEQLELELMHAQRDEPGRFDKFEKRIAAISQSLDTMIPRIATVQQEQQQVVQNIAIAQLSREKTLLVQYATQARFALAQLYDLGTGHMATKVDTKLDNKLDNKSNSKPNSKPDNQPDNKPEADHATP